MNAICVFCGSSPGNDPAYAEAARLLGQTLAQRDTTLVYGGGHVGLMGVVADAALEAGGEVIGVMPKALVDREIGHAGLTKLHVVRSMHERKALMSELSEGFVALPGGNGTLEEFFEVLTWAQLGEHHKPCGLLNVAGYYDPLLAATAKATLVAPPQATTSPAGGLTPTSATLNALVDPNGEDATYRFEYAEEAVYDANEPNPYAQGGKTAEAAIAGGEARTVSHGLTGLRPGTTYHYRIVATNSLGTPTAGTDQTFTTPAEPPANRLPTADNDTYTVAEDAQLVVEAPGVLEGDADPDGDTLSAAKAAGPSHGTLSLQPNGFFLYTPNENFNGRDSFTYRASDGTGQSDAATVNIDVTPVDEPPPSNAPPTIRAISPTGGSEIHHRTPTVRAKVMDSGTDLRKDDIRLWVDGKRVEKFSYDRARDLLSYATPKLGYGRHTVLIVARDGKGLSANRLWGFRVVKR